VHILGFITRIFQAMLTWAPDGGKWFISHHGRLYLGKGALGNHLTGGWVGPSAGLDALEKRLLPQPGIEPFYCKDTPLNVPSWSHAVRMLPHSVGEGVSLTRHSGRSSVYEDALQGVLYDGLQKCVVQNC